MRILASISRLCVLLVFVSDVFASCPQGYVEISGVCVQQSTSCPPNYYLVNGMCFPNYQGNCQPAEVYVNGKCCRSHCLQSCAGQPYCECCTVSLMISPHNTTPPPFILPTQPPPATTPCVTQPCVTQPCPTQPCPNQLAAPQPCPTQPCQAQAQAAAPCSTQPCQAQAQAAPCPAQPCPTPLVAPCPTQPCPVQTTSQCPTQPCPAPYQTPYPTSPVVIIPYPIPTPCPTTPPIINPIPYPTAPPPTTTAPTTLYPTKASPTTPSPPTRTTSKSTTPPPAPVTECPPGTIYVGGTCRLIYCGTGYYHNNRCIQTICPVGTVWTGIKCAVPDPIEQSVVFKNTVVTHFNRNNSDVIVNNVNNFTFNNTIEVSPNGVPPPPPPPPCEEEDCDESTRAPPQPTPSSPPTTPSPRTNCCNVLTPRVCSPHPRSGKWNCYTRRYRRCGEFCVAPTIYLKAPRTRRVEPYLVMPPDNKISSCRQANSCVESMDPYDCSGCAEGFAESCSSYCYRPNCMTRGCAFYDQQSYCDHSPGECGCQEQDGCFDDWCGGSAY